MAAEPYHDEPQLGGATAGATTATPSKTAEIQMKIDETVGIMRDNIKSVADRGVKLDVLHTQTDELSNQSQNFRRGANRVRKQMWWKDMKMRIIIAVVVLILLLAIILPLALKHDK